jgi:hypothetical protein
LLVRPWKAGVSPKALVADTVPPEVLAGLSEADPVRSAFVCGVFELNVVVIPPTHRAGLKSPRRRLSKGLVAAAWAGMLDWACRDWAPVGLALCHVVMMAGPARDSTGPCTLVKSDRRHRPQTRTSSEITRRAPPDGTIEPCRDNSTPTIPSRTSTTRDRGNGSCGASVAGVSATVPTHRPNSSIATGSNGSSKHSISTIGGYARRVGRLSVDPARRA